MQFPTASKAVAGARGTDLHYLLRLLEHDPGFGESGDNNKATAVWLSEPDHLNHTHSETIR